MISFDLIWFDLIWFELENIVDKAQAKSPLYSSYGITAPPLEKDKVKTPRHLGKGWFNLQVSI